MIKNYEVESIDGEHRIYTKRLKNASGIIFLPKNERRIRVGFLGKLLQFFLLPVTFDPLAKTFVIYEFVRTVLIMVTLVIVPLQVGIELKMVLSAVSNQVSSISLDRAPILIHYYDNQYVKVRSSLLKTGG